MSKRKSLLYQINEELESQCRFGESKKAARKVEKTHNPQGIFSFSTFNGYKSICINFGKWAKKKYNCRTLDELKPYAKEYINERIDRNLSAWTIDKDKCAIAKLFKVTSPSFGAKDVDRDRNSAKKSRGEVKNFSEKMNPDLVDFCKGTGLRRHELRALKCEDVSRNADGQLTVHVLKGKGGKERMATVLPEYADRVEKIARRKSPKQNVFDTIRAHAPVHHYRAEYATAYYKLFARPLDEIPRKERYYCRKDMVGIVLDERAMLETSRKLGHNRVDVIASSYLCELKREIERANT